MGLANDVTFAGYVPAEELPALYSAATALLMPSQYEGFGFPLLEAMACGAPVIGSRASSLPELAGDAALLIDPNDAIGLAAAIRQLIDQPELAASLRQRGLIQANNFTWEATARQTAQLYQEVAKVRSRV
jgi:glycosyltransferase involved in cell wall biosynthesis